MVYFSKADADKLFEISTEEVQTKARISFTPPTNIVDEPVVFIGKQIEDMKPFKCIGYQGMYVNEQQYLNELL